MKTILPVLSAISSRPVSAVVKQNLFYLKWLGGLQGPLVRLVLLLTVSAYWSIGVNGQEIVRPGESNFLPPATGEALTLTPNDMPDVSCSVVEWKDDPAIPALAVICPPQDTFAPLHVYLRLSWLKPEDVPSSARGIAAPANTLIKIRTKESTAWIWVGVRDKHGASHRKWVAFKGVLDMALLTLRSKH